MKSSTAQKNNFALVVSLLELQKRTADDPRLADALDGAVARVDSFARAYANLADRSEYGVVRIRPYLSDVVERMRQAAFNDGVTIDFQCDDCELPREIAVAIGLYTNEAMTNVAKHAFPDGANGNVRIIFSGAADSWSLVVEDNGRGIDGYRPASSGGLGSRLFSAFAQQACATHVASSLRPGHRVKLTKMSAPR
jgi:two-component sensor histidine kinase